MEAATRRIVVAGGLGFFGAAAISLLRELNLRPVAASRRVGTELRLDVEDAASLRAALRPGDLVLDAAGPYQQRSMRLVEAAIEIGCDLVDLSDSLAYALRLQELEPQIRAAGIRICPACSTVSALTAHLAQRIGIDRPARISGFLIPATRYSPSPGSSASLLQSIGRQVRVYRSGRLMEAPGWIDSRRASFTAPFGELRGHLFESADSVWLPRIWPTLEAAELYVDTRLRPLNALLSLAARNQVLHHLVKSCQAFGHRLVRRWGSRASGIAVEVEAADGQIRQAGFFAPDNGYRMAVAPAALAIARLARQTEPNTGLVLPPAQFDAIELDALLMRLGIETV